ncbi:hypothetical protein T11_1741 [Trichinella zimbabwensis]|uniref:Uncharacterized protein n=1 Tax=Trichinella zimbabwensis TaxID=268475 RepID=A0A0V1GJ24_9BILA|nr:hypothetical protein T11_1741 [Trichinella zimbabwensis]
MHGSCMDRIQRNRGDPSERSIKELCCRSTLFQKMEKEATLKKWSFLGDTPIPEEYNQEASAAYTERSS